MSPSHQAKPRRVVRRFTPDEEAEIEGLRIGGMKLGAIGRKLGRGRSAVRERLIALARRQEEEIDE